MWCMECEAKGTWGRKELRAGPWGWNLRRGREWSELRPRRQAEWLRKDLTANAKKLNLHCVFLTLTAE